MTNLLVADPYFPYAFPYVYDYHLEHGAFPLPETEEDGDEEAAPILVQLAPPDDVEFVVEGIEEEEEDPEEPEEDSADEDGFHDPPQNEADWQHLMEVQHLNAMDNGWESDEEEVGDEEAIPVLVQIAPLLHEELVVVGNEAEAIPALAPIAPPENEDLEEDPEEDPEEEEPMEIWGNEGSDGESESDDEEEPRWLGVVPDIMDKASDTGDVPPPLVETDIGPYKAQFPNTF
ncbi:hypothetical protein RHMOL_Rhmol06G0122500 [Rhododendron molle]|uniref:Uncharacterized protein n=1 Tax=Rhododendron molle TaxID=49168 RepID=A0ACC0ND33_RHOML|nr:hypothetical protein RHMOL_Rhmol06G0122500 [Rhododendron molle]